MSELVLAVVAGPEDRNSGAPRAADITGALYVGGSGVWEFRSRAESAPYLRLRATGDDVGAESAAGVALGVGRGRTADAAERLLGPGWRGKELSVEASELRELATTAFDVSVSVVITDLDGGQVARLETETSSWPWSVVLAGPVVSRRNSQWGESARS